MTAEPTHQPVAYQIEDANGEFMCLSRTKSTIRGVTSRPLYAEPALEKERTARQEAQAMADCLDMLRTDLIAAEVIGPDVAPMFMTEAVLSSVSLERAARIEAQQRLADMQELAAKSGLAHRMAVQRCVHAAVAEAVAAEREACKAIAVAEQKTMCEIAMGHPDGSASRDRLFARARSAESIAQEIEKRGTP